MKPPHQLQFNFVEISHVKFLGKASSSCLEDQRSNSCSKAWALQDREPHDATKKKHKISPPQKKRTIGPKIGPNLGPKTGPRNWSPGAVAINFLKDGRILDQFLVQFLGPKTGPRNRRKNTKNTKIESQLWAPMWGPAKYSCKPKSSLVWETGLPYESFCWKLTSRDPPTMPLARQRASQLLVVLVGNAPCIALIMHYAGKHGTQKQTSTQSNLHDETSILHCI